MSTVTASTTTQNEIYDANGTLLLQKDPTNGATLFLGDTQLHQANGSTNTSVIRTYTALGTPVAERTSAAGATTSTVYWIGTDIDGTSDLEINTTSNAVTHRYQDPYGNARGTTPPWSSPNGYLNAPNSTFSNLTQLGARAYDPSIGKFITVDGVLSPLDPQQNNGYDYSRNNPITFSDPSGQKALGQFDNDWQGNTDQNGGDNTKQNAGAHGTGAYQAPAAPGNANNATSRSSLPAAAQERAAREAEITRPHSPSAGMTGGEVAALAITGAVFLGILAVACIIATAGICAGVEIGVAAVATAAATDGVAVAAEGAGAAEGVVAESSTDLLSGTNQVGQLTSRSSFRVGTVQDAWNEAVDGPTGGKLCPSCGTEVTVAPKSGVPRDWDVSHNPSWTNRQFSGDAPRSDIVDNYNQGTGLECPQCNRSAGNDDSRFGG